MLRQVACENGSCDEFCDDLRQGAGGAGDLLATREPMSQLLIGSGISVLIRERQMIDSRGAVPRKVCVQYPSTN